MSRESRSAFRETISVKPRAAAGSSTAPERSVSAAARIAAMGGDVYVESGSEGTRFSVRLPAA